MSDNQELDQSGLESAPAEKPAEPTPQLDLKGFQESLSAEFDKRFRGVQSMTDSKFAELQRTIEELRAANLSPEEQEQLEIAQAKSEAEELRRENALLKMRREYPEEVDFLDEFFKAKTLEDQLGALASFRKVQEQAAPQEEPTPTPTPVSGNNAPRRATPSAADMGVEMNDQLADQILGASGNEPGLLRRLFGG